MHLLDDPYDWVRAVNALLGVVALAAMCLPRAVRWWVRQQYATRMYLVALAAMLAATVAGTVQAILADSPGGPHVYAYTLGLITAVIATVVQQIGLRRDTHE